MYKVFIMLMFMLIFHVSSVYSLLNIYQNDGPNFNQQQTARLSLHVLEFLDS